MWDIVLIDIRAGFETTRCPGIQVRQIPETSIALTADGQSSRIMSQRGGKEDDVGPKPTGFD
jgi:hypothetical protein